MKTKPNGEWIPEGVAREYGRRYPEVGQVVAYDYRAWEVTHVRIEDFSEDEWERAKHYTPAGREGMKPYRVSLHRIHGAPHARENSQQDIALRLRAFAYRSFEVYDEGRVPLCSCCGNPWPCLFGVAKEQSEQESKRLEERLTRAGVGLCYACGEVITTRQKSAEYGKGNVDLPGYPTPRFHLRESCRYERIGYMDRVMRSQGVSTVVHEDDNGSLW